MGQWNISIHGTGVHHNKSVAEDADLMAAEFVEKLKAAGHTVVHATITHGGETNITDGAKYVEDKAKFAKS